MQNRTLVIVASLAAVLASGCRAKDPLDTQVQAADSVGFASWQADMSDKLTTDQQRDLADALQEMKFLIMAGGASSSNQVELALLDRIRDRTLRQVLGDGLGLKLQRDEKDRADLDEAVRINVALARRPNADDLEDRQAQIKSQLSRIEAADKEISRLRMRMAADGLNPPVPPPAQAHEAVEK